MDRGSDFDYSRQFHEPLFMDNGQEYCNEFENTEANKWIRYGMRLFISSSLHPLEYSKVLMQLGYEPIAPVVGKSFFGKPIMFLPNIFQYAGYIRRVDGFFGMYRGLTPKLVGSLLSVIASEKISHSLGLNDVDENYLDNPEIKDDAVIFNKFKEHLKKDLIIQVSGLVVAHPFMVISWRMMSQFIGRETLYDSLVGSIAEIFRNDGISGFFAGLIPKLLCEISCLLVTSTTVYFANKHFIKDKTARQYNTAVVQFVCSSLFYPLQVVSSCMCVTGSGLAAGSPPYMPQYANWTECFYDLQVRGDLKRGSSVFWRSIRPSSSTYKRLDFAPLPVLAKYN